MFENLGSVEWAKLCHSHGTAEEVPARLAALVGPSDEDRAKALDYFWSYMLHQGTRYEASPFTVPFLFEALEDAEFPLQQQLIDLLLGLAVGYGESFLPEGYDLEKEEQRIEEGSWEGLFGDGDDARSAYYEVHKRAETFTRFLRPDCHPETRLSAGFAVAHFTQSLPGIHGEVAEYIHRESDEFQLQSLILCFGMLGRYAGAKPDVSILMDFLEPDRSQSLRVAASIALTTILGPRTPDSALRILLTALKESWKLPSPRDAWWWNDGDLLGYAALVLPMAGTSRRDEIAYALCEALARTEACTFAIPQTLLVILFPEPKSATGRQVSEFDEVQRASLNILLRTGHWRTWMIDSRFLPSGLTGDDYRDALHRFIDEITGGLGISDSELFRRAGNVSSWDFEKHWK
jgi:hypothetical protein